MEIKQILNRNRIDQCRGRMSVDFGVLSIDCRECQGHMELHHAECFNGLSRRMIPGFRGPVVLKGEIHNRYDGPIVDAVSGQSQILKDIHDLGGPDDRARDRLKKVVGDVERELLSDPIKLIERKDLYLNRIRKTLRDRQPPAVDRFLSIIDQTTRMVRRLERETKKQV